MGVLDTSTAETSSAGTQVPSTFLTLHKVDGVILPLYLVTKQRRHENAPEPLPPAARRKQSFPSSSVAADVIPLPLPLGRLALPCLCVAEEERFHHGSIYLLFF